MHIGSEFYTQNELTKISFKSIGEKVLIKKNVSMYFVENISIGNNVRIDDNTIIVASKKDVIIHDNVNMASNCYIAGSEGFEIFEFSTLAPGVMIFTGSDDYLGKKLTGATVPKEYTGGKHGKITIGKHCILGAGTVVLPDIVICDGVSVGTLSLVSSNLYSWRVYAGIPVKMITNRSKELLELEKQYRGNCNV
ncbi:MAG: hypothetical protein K9L30_18355 [Desulfobacterales bacterium]|nr:hypothetical protein [Desulfobacterales bacterium]